MNPLERVAPAGVEVAGQRVGQLSYMWKLDDAYSEGEAAVQLSDGWIGHVQTFQQTANQARTGDPGTESRRPGFYHDGICCPHCHYSDGDYGICRLWARMVDLGRAG